MQIYLDDRVLGVACASPAEGLHAAAAEARKLGRLVTGARLNGVELSADEVQRLVDPGDTPGPAGAVLHVSSTDARMLVRQTLEGVSRALEQAVTHHHAAADHLEHGRVPDAMRELGAALSIWQALEHAVRLAGSASSDEVLATARGRPASVDRLAGELPALAADLAEVKRSLQDRDWSALGDALRYELPAHVERWRAELARACADLARGG